MDDGWNETLLWLTFRADRMGEDFPHYRRILDFIAARPTPTPVQAVAEPVAWMSPNGREIFPANTVEWYRQHYGEDCLTVREYSIPLYAAPVAALEATACEARVDEADGNHGLTNAVKAIAARYPMVAIARALDEVLPGLVGAFNARLDRTTAERDDAMTVLVETAAERDALLASEVLITVCSSCLRACCWQGEFMCDEAEGAGTVRRKVSELRATPHGESEHYWQAEITAALTPQASGEGSK